MTVQAPGSQRIWTASFISVSVVQLMAFAVFYALIAALPLFVVGELGGTAAQAGLVITLMIVAQVAIRFVAAPILQCLGMKRGLILSVLAFAVITFAYIWADNLAGLYAIRIMQGIPFGVISTATGAIAANIVPAQRRGEGIGYFAMATSLAVVIGPFVALTLLPHISFPALFAVLGIGAVATTVLAVAVRLPSEERTATAQVAGGPEPAQRRRRSINDFIDTRALPISAVAGVITLAYAGITAFVPVYAEGLGLQAAAAYFFVVYAATMLITRPYIGRRFDRRGANSVIIPGLVLYAAGFAALSQISTSWMLLAAAVLIGLGFGAVQPSMQTMAVQSTSSARAGYATATFFSFFDGGIAIGSVILGLVVDVYGFSTLYLASAILILLVIGLYLPVAAPRRAVGNTRRS